MYKGSSSNNNNNHQSTDSDSENQTTSTPTTDIIYIKQKAHSPKGRILIVDDEPDIASTFGVGLQDEGFEAYTYNDPLEALLNFKPDFYDLLLIDINLPKMNGFELCTQILKLDINVRICFITAGEANIEALREVYSTISLGCFIKKPIRIDQLVKRVKAELE
jgi:DNA-binding response OmpR family regulator